MLDDFIVVVTGMPRSGTTMMMRMLEAGGIEPYYDQSRPMSWVDGGKEFINYNLILRETDKIYDLIDGNSEWLNECYGKAVKILSPSKIKIPKEHRYLFIYMDRKLKHMVRSQQKFLTRAGRSVGAGRYEMGAMVADAKRKGLATLRNHNTGSELLVVPFERVLKQPLAAAIMVQRFLGVGLDIEAMARVVVDRPAFCMTSMLEEVIYAKEDNHGMQGS